MHFSLLVVMDSYSKEALDGALAPFKEFDGDASPFAVEIDKTAEALEEFNKATVWRMRDPNGNLHELFTDKGEWKAEFSRPNKKTYPGDRELFVPPGYERVDVPASSVETAAEWISGHYGWGIIGKSPGEKLSGGHISVDGAGNVVRCIDITNPNGHWDWWQLGGRYSGKFHVRAGAPTVRGESRGNFNSPMPPASGTDAIRWGDIDLDAMLAEQRGHRRAWIDEIVQKSGLTRATVDELLPKLQPRIAALHDEWQALPTEGRPGYADWLDTQITGDAKAIRKATWDLPDIDSDQTIEAWIAAALPLTCFAMLKDGEWFEKGWARLSTEQEAAFHERCQRIFDTIRPDQWIVCVDCHT